MKKALYLAVGLLLLCNAWSQPALTPSSPVLGTPRQALETSSPALDLAVFTNVPGPITNFAVADVVFVLSNLQVAVEQALPVVAAFNESFVFVPLPGNMFGVQRLGNFSSNLGVNFSTNLGSNFAMNNGVVFGSLPGAIPPFTGQGFPLGLAALTNGLTGDTVRAMLFLQDDLFRAQNLLMWLNGTNAAGMLTNGAEMTNGGL